MQHRFRFDFADGPLTLDTMCVWDRVAPCDGVCTAEPILLFAHEGVEEGLRAYAGAVAAASPLPPRLPPPRITGWCFWYNLYAAIDEPPVLEHLAAARPFRDRPGAPLRALQIDDGFTPEMGDWLEVKPQFPRGMAPLLGDIRAAGFTPGWWIAPFLVGNRSRLDRDHPGWVVTERGTGAPLVAYRFYAEFRWHKRGEEYHVLDGTHPEAEASIREVFRAWARDWAAGYFEVGFMHVGSDHGAGWACRREAGLTRIECWMRMARPIREEIGEALCVGSGCPLLPPTGLFDGLRIGRDIGVTWTGHHAAQPLSRDQATRNFLNGILWQADPDCILPRDRFHDVSDTQIRSLALFAAHAGGVLMTSDHLAEIAPARAELFTALLREEAHSCDFPLLRQAGISYRHGHRAGGTPTLAAHTDPVLVRRISASPAGGGTLSVFNTGDLPVERLLPWPLAGPPPAGRAVDAQGRPLAADGSGIHVRLARHETLSLCSHPTRFQPRRPARRSAETRRLQSHRPEGNAPSIGGRRSTVAGRAVLPGRLGRRRASTRIRAGRR